MTYIKLNFILPLRSYNTYRVSESVGEQDINTVSNNWKGKFLKVANLGYDFYKYLTIFTILFKIL